jgi:hypothetical protein
MNLNKLLAVLKPKPKQRPIYVDNEIVGWDDGLPNSVKIDRTKLQEALTKSEVYGGVGIDAAQFVDLVAGNLACSGYFSLNTKRVFADKALVGYYVACTGVDTGGAYFRIRDRMPHWVDNVYTCYWAEIGVARATADVRLYKTVAGTNTILGTEAVDLTAESRQIILLSASGTSIKLARTEGAAWGVNPTASVPAGDIKISATDTDIASGTMGFCDVDARYTPATYWGACSYWGNADIVHRLAAIIRSPASSPPEPLAYFEVPVVGSGKLPKTPDGDIRPVTIWDSEEIKSQVDPFRVEMPEEIVEIEQPMPKYFENKVNVLRAKGWTTEEIKAFMPEAFPVERINRLAITSSALIPTDSKGKPTSNTAIVRVFPSSPEYCHSIEKRIQAIKEMRGVRQLSREEAISLALKMDDKLHIHDLVPCLKHDLGGKCYKEYYEWREFTVGDKPEFAETDIRKHYVKETKGW